MATAKISTKGQLVIPNRFRKALHLQAGDKVSFSLVAGKLILEREEPNRARLIEKDGRKVLVAPPTAPPMTPEFVKTLLADYP
jgi:AbrB family looped-hinge helix DNA binding protein